MQNTALIDSGVLVALFDKSDAYHQQAVEFIKTTRINFVSSVAVMTEVCYLLDFSVDVQLDFLNWVRQGAIQIEHLLLEDLDRLMELTRKYSDLPMDFADATLVVFAERLGINAIASVDSDFYIYRFKGRQHFTNIFLK